MEAGRVKGGRDEGVEVSGWIIRTRDRVFESTWLLYRHMLVKRGCFII